MATVPQKGKKSKAGRQKRSPAHANYKNNRSREKNKVRRVLKSGGLKAAEEWANKNGVITYLRGLPVYLRKKTGE